MYKNMNLEQAKQVIEMAINQGMLKGVYSLSDAVQIIDALRLIHSLDDKK